jgi:uncharacterized protein YbjT (DUF2867 family)
MSLPAIAIAGGSSQLGRCIVQSLLDNGKYRPIVLSRESSETPLWIKDLGVEVRRLDYLSKESCTEALKSVHTVSYTAAHPNHVALIDFLGHLDSPL